MKKMLLRLLLAAFLLSALPVSALAEGRGDSPDGLAFTLPEEQRAYACRLTDGYVMSRVSLTARQSVTISLAGNGAGLLLSWYEAPGSYAVTQADGDGTALTRETVTDGFLNRYVPLEPGCRSMTLDAFDASCALSDVTLCRAEDATVQRWSPAPEKADLLVVAAAPGLEFRAFSGVLPRYTVANGVTTAIVYMSTHQKRARAEESLSALWAMGVRQYPVFGPLTARNYDSAEILEKDWKRGEAVAFLARQIARFQPEVVVTHGVLAYTGEDGKAVSPAPEESMTAAFVREAVEQAGETVQVKKLYQCEAAAALAEPACVPDWSAPLLALDGASPLSAAQAALNRCPSTRVTGKAVRADTAFLLTVTTVGQDVANDDLFEHIDTNRLAGYRAALPAVVPAAEPAAMQEQPPVAEGMLPSPPAQATPVPPEPAPEAPASGWETRLWAALGAGALLSLILCTLLVQTDADKGSRPVRAVLALLPVLAALVLALAPGMGQAKARAVPAETAPIITPAPTPVATAAAAPSPAPTAEPMEEAAPTAEEIILADEENGHWAYTSDTLQIDIHRVITEINHAPVVYFAADIRMADISEFRPVFGSVGHTGKGRMLPWKMARENKCVLWITGDNMLSDERDEKGVLIRDGKIYSKLQVEDALALYPDMSLRILKKRTPGAEELWEDGVENSFSFGPTLIENGVLNDRAVYHRVRRINPRTGIGMYEPGHFLAIVVDGRQKKQGYSAGMTIETFAALFQEYGVTTAYNLDGGLSAAMLFMGEQLNSHGGQRSGEKNDISYQRSVPDGLGFGYSEQVPGPDDPVFNTGNIKKRS